MIKFTGEPQQLPDPSFWLLFAKQADCLLGKQKLQPIRKMTHTHRSLTLSALSGTNKVCEINQSCSCMDINKLLSDLSVAVWPVGYFHFKRVYLPKSLFILECVCVSSQVRPANKQNCLNLPSSVLITALPKIRGGKRNTESIWKGKAEQLLIKGKVKVSTI